MTVTEAPVRPRPPRGARFAPVPAARMLRLELRRNPMPWIVPVLAGLFLFDPYRTAMSYPPIWDLRVSVVLNKFLPDLVAFVAGVSSWAGSRDGRRHTADLVAATARPGWARQAAALAATVCWVVGTYLAGVTALFGATGGQATWGGPQWWPVAVGVAALVALSALGFAAGVFFPGRFTAPLAAIVTFFLCLEGFRNAVGRSSVFALLSPATSVPGTDTGVFYPYLPDLAVVQVLFLAGLAAAALGALGRAPAAQGGPRLRRGAAAVIVAGLAAVGTAVGLVGTAVQGAHGVTIPALHDAASDRPIPYTPVCDQAAGVPVCLHPAFRKFLPGTAAGFGPVLSETAGLPGSPVRLAQVADGSRLAGGGAAIGGSPPVLYFSLQGTPGAFGQTTADFYTGLRFGFITAFIGGAPEPGGKGGGGIVSGNPAQQAVGAALLRAAGVPILTSGQAQSGQASGVQGPPSGSPADAAYRRFAALSAAARHAWLATHLTALRAGHISPDQVP